MPKLTRRDALRAAAPWLIFNWDILPSAKAAAPAGEFDAVIIGAGLGGLACAAAFARKGYRPLVIEQHDRAGGYATSFKRPGGFEFDVSLHSTGPAASLFSGWPELSGIEFVEHPSLYRAIFPNHDIRVGQRDLPAYVATVKRLFPDEGPGIDALFGDMQALSREIAALSRGNADMSRFAQDFPTLFRCSQQTWGQMVDARLRDPKLKAIVSAQWVYYGLPPSKLSSFYYALPNLGYLQAGGHYPKGRSQTISNALVNFIESHGGKVLLNTRVERILVKDGAAYGVRCGGGQEYRGRAVISNASAPRTFQELLEESKEAAEYKARMEKFSASLSCFQVFLGLKQDVVGRAGVKDAEIFVETGYDPDAAYKMMQTADLENGGFAVSLYDNLFAGYSPKGKNTVNILTLQGYGPWEKFEADYRAGRKTAYRAEKERMANILIRRAEEKLLPGLSKAIEVKEIGTPLTNVRYTGNYRGAIYGWDQTPDNSGNRRVSQETTVKNLYLAGAWTRPGHGYGAVISSGFDCFAAVVRGWG
jgi:phytoene dehydrogenase-like protein